MHFQDIYACTKIFYDFAGFAIKFGCQLLKRSNSKYSILNKQQLIKENCFGLDLNLIVYDDFN